MRVHVSLCRHVIRWRLCQGLLLRSVSCQNIRQAKLQGAFAIISVPSATLRVCHFAKSKPSTSTETACRLLFPLCNTSDQPNDSERDCTAALPPRFLFCLFFCFFKCDRWQLNHFVWVVVILRSYLHMPILHCLWWKYLQCVKDTQNSLVFFADRKVTGGPHITASPFLRESLTNADMFCINRLRLFVGGGVNACDDFISSDCTFWWSIEI